MKRVCFLLALLAPPTLGAQSDSAQAAYLRGDYRRATSLFERALDRDAESVEAARGLMRSLSIRGRYADALDVADNFDGDELQLRVLIGDVHLALGSWDRAEEEYGRALEGGARDSVRARRRLAELWDLRGDRESATRAYEWFVSHYNSSRNLPVDELTDVGFAVARLGATNSRLLDAAIRIWSSATRRNRLAIEPRLLTAELLLRKYNSSESAQVLTEISEINSRHPRYLLAMARRAHFDGESEARLHVERSLEANPRYAEARAFMAQLFLEVELYDQARAEANRALETNPNSLEALTVLAAAERMSGNLDEYQLLEGRVAALNPRYAEFYNTVAELLGRNRLYREALEVSRRAVELDSTSWRGWSLLGTNQLRLGMIEIGRASLQRSFDGDPFNVWTKNTLDLVDTFEDFGVTRTDNFEIWAEAREAELLGIYFGPLAEAALDSLTRRYSYRMTTPVRIEVFPTHADFSVRTVGLIGLGALGVSFGPVVAMDSPSARAVGEFNWGSTLWHELVHSLTLEMTAGRMPRWFAEGLAVYEERRARQGWGADASLSYLMAYDSGQMLPLRTLNDGFVRPSYPEQVLHSYYHASLVLEVIERRHGFAAIRGLLDAYRDGESTGAAVQTVLGLSLEQVDDLVHEYVRERYGTVLDGIEPGGVPEGTDVVQLAERESDNFLAQWLAGSGLLQSGEFGAARPYLERARTLFPEFAEPNGPHVLLGRGFLATGDSARAILSLRRQTALNERDYESHVLLAEIAVALGDSAGAIAALERAIFIHPYDIDLHQTLGALYSATGHVRGWVREASAVVSLQPVDLVGAYFELARAQRAVGDLTGARRSILRALERAPNYEPAQDFLLDLRAPDGGS